MASLPQNRFQQFLQQSQQQSKPFPDLYNNNMEGQISEQMAYVDASNLLDHHPPYIPPFQVEGLSPCPVQDETQQDLQWIFEMQHQKKRPKEQDFLENSSNYNKGNNNSQISSLDLFQAPSVSTGLGLSLPHDYQLGRSNNSSLIGLFGDDISLELQRQDTEIDRFVKLQGDRLRQEILQKYRSNQLQTISCFEKMVLQKLHDKDTEVESMKKKNKELELRVEQLVLDVDAWQKQAKYNESMISMFKLRLQQAFEQRRDSKQVCGDSEVDDTASCCHGRPADSDKYSDEMKVLPVCKVCRIKEVCMLLLPCKHLCLCKDCESNTSFCPVCHCFKQVGLDIYL